MDSLKRHVPKQIKCLHRFLKENGVTISEFYKEVANYYEISIKEAKEKIETYAEKSFFKPSYFTCVIDEHIEWSNTRRGYDFWESMNCRFRPFYLKYFSASCFI